LSTGDTEDKSRVGITDEAGDEHEAGNDELAGAVDVAVDTL
jgi:hypothetical protein